MAEQRRTETKSKTWPSPQDYNEAIQNPNHNLMDPELRSGTVHVDRLGIPRPITGAFASVYKLQCAEADWAVRCFLREIPDTQWRYEHISQFVMNDTLPYTVGFHFQPDGIRVNGIPYPILKMEWVEGETLDAFLRHHKRDLDPSFPDRFRRMCVDLESAGIAHGDLQHGNIMVHQGELFLVDYDGMFVPSMAGSTSNELGHRNYQHPGRTAETFGPHLDNFSAWVIYTSLQAMVKDKWLYERLGSGDDCLLFRSTDFIDPMNSCAFAALEFHPDPELVLLSKLLRFYLRQDVDAVPPLSAPLDHVPEMEHLHPDVPQTRAQQIELQELQPEIQEQLQANLNVVHTKHPPQTGTRAQRTRSKPPSSTNTPGPASKSAAPTNPLPLKGLPPTASYNDLQEALQQLRAASGKLQENIKPPQTLSKPMPRLVVDPPLPAARAAISAPTAAAATRSVPTTQAANANSAPSVARKSQRLVTSVEPELLVSLPRRIKEYSSALLSAFVIASTVLAWSIGTEIAMTPHVMGTLPVLFGWILTLVMPVLLLSALTQDGSNSRRLAEFGRATIGQVVSISLIDNAHCVTYTYEDHRKQGAITATGIVSAELSKRLVVGQDISVLYDPGSSYSLLFSECQQHFTMPAYIRSRDLNHVQGVIDGELSLPVRTAAARSNTRRRMIFTWSFAWLVVWAFLWSQSPAASAVTVIQLSCWFDMFVGTIGFIGLSRPWWSGEAGQQRSLVEAGEVAEGVILEVGDQGALYEFADELGTTHRRKDTQLNKDTVQIGDKITVLYDPVTKDSRSYKTCLYRAK